MDIKESLPGTSPGERNEEAFILYEEKHFVDSIYNTSFMKKVGSGFILTIVMDRLLFIRKRKKVKRIY